MSSSNNGTSCTPNPDTSKPGIPGSDHVETVKQVVDAVVKTVENIGEVKPPKIKIKKTW